MNPNIYDQPQEKRLARVLSWLIFFVLAVSLVYITLALFGYGTLVVSAPQNAVISVNGHKLNTTSQRLRAGTYTITVASPTTVINQGTVHIRSFLTTTYTPSLEKRSPTALVSSAIGSYESYGPPVVDRARWFENNMWLVGSVSPGSASQIALHYVNGAWSVAYFSAGSGYPTDLTQLPSDVAAYITSLQEAIANAG